MITVSWPFAAGIAALLLFLCYRLMVLPFYANLLHCDGKIAKGKDKAAEMVFKALTIEPYNSAYLNAAAQLHMPQDPPNALLAYIKIVHHNDGQEIPWTSWLRIGQLAMVNGAVFLARSSFAKAIQLNPSFKPAHELFRESQKIVAQIEAQTKQQQQPEGRIIIPNGKPGQMVQTAH